MSSSSTATTPLGAFKAAFGSINELPYCTGSIPLDVASSTLFYRTQDKADSVNFANATDAQLAALSAACQQATFGVNKEDVLDESYRKAGKMDASEFATQFSPFTSGIIDTIRGSLLRGENSGKEINVELYKLNVYGTGSFFKAHIDTPRSDTMFGSLVVVLPTVHEGGSLLFRYRGQEVAFDTAAAVSSPNEPRAAFVAFFSDVEHEVSLVTKGYRVTLTYNLYFANPSTTTPRATSMENAIIEQTRSSLSALLADPSFLPAGGLIGFGLAHKYPFNPASTNLETLENHLKGNDATIKQLCAALSLKVSLKAVYPTDDDDDERRHCFCLLNESAEFDGCGLEQDTFDYLRRSCKGILVYDVEKREKYRRAVPIVWINPLSESNSFQTPYIAYGNEATLGYVYGDVCLVAEIASANKRNA